MVLQLEIVDAGQGSLFTFLCGFFCRFTPNFLYLAVNELDESHVGRFSFRNLEGILQVRRWFLVATTDPSYSHSNSNCYCNHNLEIDFYTASISTATHIGLYPGPISQYRSCLYKLIVDVLLWNNQVIHRSQRSEDYGGWCLEVE